MKRDLSLRRTAYQLYVKTGNVSEVARQMNLKRHTIYAWSQEENWDARLADIQQKQGLEKFLVVMDETTSPPEIIDRNQLKGKIFLIPTRTAEFISVDFIISPSGASFEE